MYITGNKEKDMYIWLADVICLVAASFFGQFAWHILHYGMDISSVWEILGSNIIYQILVFIFSYLFLSLFSSASKDIVTRGKLDELLYVIRSNTLVFLLVTLLMFVLKVGEQISRASVILTVLFSTVMMYLTHILVKKIWLKKRETTNVAQMLVVVTGKRAGILSNQINQKNDWNRKIVGWCVLEDGASGETTTPPGAGSDQITKVFSAEEIIEYVKKNVIDEVLLDVAETDCLAYPELILELESMGVTVFLNFGILDGAQSYNSVISDVCGIPTVSYVRRTFAWNQMLVKRIVDIIGALVGLVFTAIAFLIFALPIKIESKGPVFFKQNRVGKNGRIFTIYKFRSMYADAEERKKELMAQNEMKGAMFKVSDDPRVTKIGKFLRATSIDEFPQFFNVLLGDMSLVGTRPPTVEEFEHYSSYHKRRLSLKPGLSGLWQVSGRSNVDDFEDVVKMDLEYIDNWSLILDLKILLKTVWVVIARVGAR